MRKRIETNLQLNKIMQGTGCMKILKRFTRYVLYYCVESVLYKMNLVVNHYVQRILFQNWYD